MTPYTTGFVRCHCLACPVTAAGYSTELSCGSSAGEAAHRFASDMRRLQIPSTNLASLGPNLPLITVRLACVRKLSEVQSFHVIEPSSLSSGHGPLKDPHAPRPSS